MSKLKIEPGVSRIKRAKLQSSIDQTIARDIELMAQWSDNEPKYVVNELLRFAIAQAEDFQKYKAGLPANTAHNIGEAPSVAGASKTVSKIPTHSSKEEPSRVS
jgi:hypothetical protein